MVDNVDNEGLEIDAKMTTESSAVEAAVDPAGTVADVVGAVVADQADKGALETGASADPPVAEESGAKSPATPLDAVKAALEKPAADSPPQLTGKEPPKVGADGVVEKPTPEAQAEADKLLPFHNHPRWKEVTTARQAAEATVAEMTPKAQRWDALNDQFLQTGLSGEDVQPLFEGGAQLKKAGVTHEELANLHKVGVALKIGDREVFRQVAGPVIEALGLQLVEKLSPEIQTMLEEGAISEDAARQMSELHFGKRTEAARRELVEKRETTKTQQETEAQMGARFERRSASWEARTKSTDADWSRKEPFIVEAIRSQIARKAPATEEEVEAVCQSAYDQVTRVMRASGPAKATVRPAVGGPSSTAKAAPKTPLEAVKAALSGA